MNTPNKVLMGQARETLKGKWKLAVKVTLVYLVIMIVAQVLPVVKYVASFIITGPLTLGLSIFWLSFSRGNIPELDEIFKGFDTWWRAIKAQLLISIFTFLWSLLLIIPGIIASLSYSMTFFILSEDKNIGVNAAIEKSKKMMYGYKWKLCRLSLRFLGWSLLCLLTLGIGFIWLIPYMWVTLSKFYDDIKNGSPEKAPEIVSTPVTE